MAIFKTTSEILASPWDAGSLYDGPHLPLKEEWLSGTLPEIFDVNLWEQVYFEPGNIGVYVSWDPYVELYLIVFNLLTSDTKEVYRSAEEVVDRLKMFGIELQSSNIWMTN